MPDGCIMEGTWCDGVPRDMLKIRYPNGLVYYGPVYDYRQHGFGYIYYKNGERF